MTWAELAAPGRATFFKRRAAEVAQRFRSLRQVLVLIADRTGLELADSRKMPEYLDAHTCVGASSDSSAHCVWRADISSDRVLGAVSLNLQSQGYSQSVKCLPLTVVAGNQVLGTKLGNHLALFLYSVPSSRSLYRYHGGGWQVAAASRYATKPLAASHAA